MSLANLEKIRQLQAHEATAESAQRLLAAIRRNLADAKATGISDETKFDAAYKAIMQCAMLGLWASGYRPSTSTPGHHQTMIQTLGHTLDVPRERWLLLDAFRRKRNVSDYSGDPVEPDTVAACIDDAEALHDDLVASLKQRQPGWLD